MKKQKNTVLRRDVLRFGLGIAALAGLAACASQAAPSPTPAPSPTAPPVPATEPAAEPAVEPAVEPTAEPTAIPATEAPVAEAQPAASAETTVFKIDPSQSAARFTLNETLMGNPKTVIGTSTKVSGDITVSFDNPAGSQIGVLQIDASAFATDSGMRDRAIQNFILQTSQFQFITFEPTAIAELPAKVAVGDTLSFKVTGNLTIRDVVQPVTFDTTVTAKSDAELSGLAKTTVMRSAFGLTIPKVPSVADVTEEVALELEFVATKQ